MDKDLQIILDLVKGLFNVKEQQIRDLQQLQERNETLTQQLSIARQNIIRLEREKNILRFNGKRAETIDTIFCDLCNDTHIHNNEECKACCGMPKIEKCLDTFIPSRGSSVNIELKCSLNKGHSCMHENKDKQIAWL